MKSIYIYVLYMASNQTFVAAESEKSKALVNLFKTQIYI